MVYYSVLVAVAAVLVAAVEQPAPTYWVAARSVAAAVLLSD